MGICENPALLISRHRRQGPRKDTRLKGVLVITTIASPTPAIVRCRALLEGWPIVVVGDRKTPTPWHVDGIDYIPFDVTLSPLAAAIPADSYSRKNLGYLQAIRAAAPVILETDDDNSPYDTFGKRLSRQVTGSEVHERGWVNAYRAFTDKPIWPRGLPLTVVGPSLRDVLARGENTVADCPIQQFLADGDPDVDAIYRLTRGDEVDFHGEPLILRPGTYTPLNSQNTAWWPETYRLLYVPSYVSWRVSDIWRGLVAVAVAQVRGWSVAVLPPTVRQDRNPHDLLKDFREEVPVYLETADVLERLIDAVAGAPDNAAALRLAWAALVDSGSVPREELAVVDAWNEALSVASCPR
jgi:hypothetical protein